MVEALIENRLKVFIESLDKETWRSCKFSEIAFNIVEKVTPKESDLTHYIGLEHLDSGSIHIKRFGNPQSLDGDKLKIYKGDVIVGKRNAYLKRAAVAEFDAIASAHSFVLRANPEVILPELFPFFMLSERFWETAIRISVGSLSPTINWKSLAVQEFLIPPQEQQAKLAELLLAADEVSEKYAQLIKSLQGNRDVLLKAALYKFRAEFPETMLGDLADLTGGHAFKSTDFSTEKNGKRQVLKIANLTQNGLDLSKVPAFLTDNGYDKKYLFQKGDIIISLTGSNGKRDYGFAVINESNESYWVNQRVAIIRTNPTHILPKFLYYLMKEDIFLDKFFINAIGTANQANVSIKDIQQIKLPIPPVPEQERLVSEVNNVITTETKLDSLILYTKKIQRHLVNQIFS